MNDIVKYSLMFLVKRRENAYQKSEVEMKIRPENVPRLISFLGF